MQKDICGQADSLDYPATLPNLLQMYWKPRHNDPADAINCLILEEPNREPRGLGGIWLFEE